MVKSVFSKVMWVGRATVFCVGLAVVLAVTVGMATTALAAAPGDPFKLGKNNRIDKISKLVGDASGALLRIDNNGGGAALDLRVEPGNTPMTVSSDAQVDNLNADKLDGEDSTAFFGYGSTIPSGETITGAFGGREESTSSATVIYEQTVSFPIPASADLTNETVNFANSGVGADDDTACTGNDDNPTAPPGKVCIYDSGILGAVASDSASGEAIPNNNSRRGFIVRFSGVGTAGVAGTWAYTAP